MSQPDFSAFDPQDMHADRKAEGGRFGGLIATPTAGGMVRDLVEVLNQSDEVVMSLKAMNAFACRGPA